MLRSKYFVSNLRKWIHFVKSWRKMSQIQPSSPDTKVITLLPDKPTERQLKRRVRYKTFLKSPKSAILSTFSKARAPCRIYSKGMRSHSWENSKWLVQTMIWLSTYAHIALSMNLCFCYCRMYLFFYTECIFICTYFSYEQRRIWIFLII